MTTTPTYASTDMDTPAAAAFRNALAHRNRRLTKRLVLATAALAALVLIPAVLLAVVTFWQLDTADDPLAGLGIVIAVFATVPVIVGFFVSALGLVWAPKAAGPVVAGIGLGINGFVVFLIGWTWFPLEF